MWRPGPSTLIAAAALALLCLGCGGSGEDGGTGPPATRPDSRAEYEPSPKAVAEIRADRLAQYRRVGAELGLDWTVIAAAAELETNHGGGAEEPDAIGLALGGLGAPEDYRTALSVRGGPRFAADALRLAESYRAVLGEEAKPPAERGLLGRPVGGELRAAFGRLAGVLHDGADFDARADAEVRAAASGAVTASGSAPFYGRYVCLLHRFPAGLRGRHLITTCYAHLGAVTVERGQVVERGGVLGPSGCTGLCLSPRVHFMVRLGPRETSRATDPLPYMEAG